MKWFKHETDARNSLKLRKVRRKYGADGYAIYWFCLEAIAYEVDKDNLTFDLKEDAETIAFELSIQEKRVEEIMRYLVKAELFESSQGVVTCLKLAERLDKSMTNSPKMRTWLDTKSVMTSPDQVMTDADQVKTCAELEVDKNRIEESNKHTSVSRFIEFWDLYAKKKDTAKCKSKFEKLSNTDVDKIFEVLPLYIESTPDVKFRKHPSTWLNNKCWLDANDTEQLEYINWEAIKDYYNESMPRDNLAVITKARQNKIIIMLTNTGRVGKMQASIEGHIDNMAGNNSGFWPSWRNGNTDLKGKEWPHKGFDFYMSEEIFLKSLEE